MKQYVLNEQLKTALLDYLSTRPIREALQLFEMLRSLPQMPAATSPVQEPLQEQKANTKSH